MTEIGTQYAAGARASDRVAGAAFAHEGVHIGPSLGILRRWGWLERMWAAGEPIDPSPTIDQAISGEFPWIEIECSRCRTKRDVDMAVLRHPPTTFVHGLASRLRCSKCAEGGRRPAATLLQLAPRGRHPDPET